jgi:hypothetical protein
MIDDGQLKLKYKQKFGHSFIQHEKAGAFPYVKMIELPDNFQTRGLSGSPSPKRLTLSNTMTPAVLS